MAHRRAASRPRMWGRWLLVPLTLTLDTAAALNLTGQPFPMGVIVPEGVLLATPLLVYGALAFLAFRTRSLGARLGAVAILLGIHAGLVALHTVCYVGLWSLPVPAALRLAHRWSPLIPLLQLVWVPLLAWPLASLARRRPSPPSRRSAPTPARRDVLASRTPHAALRVRGEPDRDDWVAPGGAGLARVAVAEAVTAVEPEPVPEPVAAPAPAAEVAEVSAVPPPAAASGGELLSIAPAPTWFDGLVEASAHAVVPALPTAEAVDEAVAGDDQAATPVAVAPIAVGHDATVTPVAVEPVAAGDEAAIPVLAEPDTVGDDQPAIPVAVEPVAAVPALTGDMPEDELPGLTDVAPVMEAVVPDVSATEAPPPATEPPLDLDLVARVFAPYGPLLSRDRVVVVDWTPGPDAAVVCVAPREMPRDHVVRLGARLARGLDAAEVPSAPGPVHRVSLRGPEGVAVMTPLAGAVLVAAARRRGALALLEVLSRRVGHPEGRGEPGDGEPGVAVPASAAGPALVDLRAAPEGPPPGAGEPAVACAVRVQTPTAWVDVVAPPRIEAESVGAFVGRLVTALADGEAAGAADFHTLSVDLPAHRLVIQPVHPHARPPRFVAVVGGPERPGLLGRRAERAARTLREAS